MHWFFAWVLGKRGLMGSDLLEESWLLGGGAGYLEIIIKPLG